METLSNEMIIARAIERAKEYMEKYNAPTLLKAFDEEIYLQYEYVRNHIIEDEGGSTCGRLAYTEMYYSAAMGETEFPYIYRLVLSNYYSFKAPPQDNKALGELRTQIIERRKYIDDITNKTAQMRLMLSNIPIGEAAEHIGPLLEWRQITKQEGSIGLYIDLFNLGYIEGKRAERKKKRLCS